MKHVAVLRKFNVQLCLTEEYLFCIVKEFIGSEQSLDSAAELCCMQLMCYVMYAIKPRVISKTIPYH